MPIITCLICGTEAQVRRAAQETCGSKTCSYSLRSRRKAETANKTEGIMKQCVTCSVMFIDVTRRKTSKNCPSCVKSNMVKSRRERGLYSQSPERRQLQREIMNKKYAEGWNPNTPEHRAKLSRLSKERWASGRGRGKGLHWTQTPEGKIRCSELNRGRVFNDETRARMSASAAKRVREGRLKVHRGRGGFREDLGFYVRSTWEANFARSLKFQGIQFEYEPTSFTLSNGKTYTPDFRVGEVFYEIKGYLTDTAKSKLELFRIEYPDVIVQIIGPVEYNELYITHANLTNWETT